MNESAKLILNSFEYLRKKIYFKEGLFSLCVLSFASYLFFAVNIGPHVMRAMSWSGYPLSQELASVLFLFGFMTVILLVLAFWYRVRLLPRINQNELGVLFVPYFSEILKEEVDKLFILLKQELKLHELGNQFSVLKLPPNIIVNSHDDAVSVLAKCNATVMVWGLFDNSVTTSGFSPIRFTFRHSPIIPSKEWLDRIAIPIACGRWQFESKNIPIERQILAKNIDLIARNLIGLALFVGGFYQASEKVFFSLLADVRIKVSEQKTNLTIFRRFLDQVEGDYAASIVGQIHRLYIPHLFSERLFEIPSTELNGWISKLDAALNVNPRDSEIYILKSIFYFILDRADKALHCARRAKIYDQRAQAAVNFSLAFIYNFMGQFGKSKKEYKSGMAKVSSYEERLIRECLYFIRQAIEKYPEKKQLRLALGLIEFYRGSREIAVEEIKTFVDLAKDNTNLSDFIAEAHRLLVEADKPNDHEEANIIENVT